MIIASLWQENYFLIIFKLFVNPFPLIFCDILFHISGIKSVLLWWHIFCLLDLFSSSMSLFIVDIPVMALLHVNSGSKYGSNNQNVINHLFFKIIYLIKIMCCLKYLSCNLKYISYIVAISILSSRWWNMESIRPSEDNSMSYMYHNKIHLVSGVILTNTIKLNTNIEIRIADNSK